MLKVYEKPELQILCILDRDVITASDSNGMTVPGNGQLPEIGGDGEGTTPWDS